MKQTTLITRIRKDSTEGLKMGICPVKGRTVITTREFTRGEHLVNYAGDIILSKEAARRDAAYDESIPPVGSYMLHFNFIPTSNKRLNIPLW